MHENCHEYLLNGLANLLLVNWQSFMLGSRESCTFRFCHFLPRASSHGHVVSFAYHRAVFTHSAHADRDCCCLRFHHSFPFTHLFVANQTTHLRTNSNLICCISFDHSITALATFIQIMAALLNSSRLLTLFGRFPLKGKHLSSL